MIFKSFKLSLNYLTRKMNDVPLSELWELCRIQNQPICPPPGDLFQTHHHQPNYYEKQ